MNTTPPSVAVTGVDVVYADLSGNDTALRINDMDLADVRGLRIERTETGELLATVTFAARIEPLHAPVPAQASPLVLTPAPELPAAAESATEPELVTEPAGLSCSGCGTELDREDPDVQMGWIRWRALLCEACRQRKVA